MSWIILIFVLLVASIKNRGSDRKMTVSIIIPAYNESKTIEKVINASKSLNYVDEVIVVDDGSLDNTAEVAEKSGAIVIRHATNLGKGSALKTGFKLSKGDIVAFIDADLYNLTSGQIEKIIKPILDGKADITKTKFKRKAGRVTELTAKPLLNFFFPELKFDQPLSGQFAAKKTFLNKIKFEKDYGVDVGIVLDADVRGMRIKEVDIGEIEHSHSSIQGLNKMANEVVRTIVDRAMEYGRISMMDTLGKYIRMCILGLSLTSLGLFSIFFINKIPALIGALLVLIGLFMTLYYMAKLVKRIATVLSKADNRLPTLKSLFYMHFPIIVSGLILVSMIFTLVGSVHVDPGKISIEPASSNLIIWKDPTNIRSEVRGPYTVDSALENEYNIIRMPLEAMSTLEFNYGDSIYINKKKYTINTTRAGEENILRIPYDARNYLSLNAGDIIRDSNIRGTFKDLYAEKALAIDSTFNNTKNFKANEGIFLKSSNEKGRIVNVYVNKQKMLTTYGIFENGEYSIYINNAKYKTIKINKNDSKNVVNIPWGKYTITIDIEGSMDTDTRFATSTEGKFLNLLLKK
ncbi:MAG: glycosyltransferase [Methanobacterium sp.]|uniref:glycosyltransferase n=1 Tax=Methanobacterium sp. TaxID=2164 RepID=UPI003D661221|nr:glycosyltransferase [Methanobacterium sp.]